MKNSVLIGALLITICHQHLKAQETDQVLTKRQSRIIGGLASTKHDNFTATDAYAAPTIGIGGFTLGYEKFKTQQSKALGGKLSNGIGISTSNYFGFSANYNSYTVSLDWYEASKHYLSAYAFAEYDVKKIATIGLAAGPSAMYMHAVANPNNAINPSLTAGKFSGGLNLRQYIQKYVLKNNAGQRTLFIRLGLEQYIMTNAGATAGVNLSLGF